MSDYAENTAENDENKIPVNIITGFLGSGKTTLLNHWVNSPEFKDTLVLINEFGDVGLDHELVEAVDSSVVLLQSGCICCSLQGALVDSLATNFIKAQRGDIPAFKRVSISWSVTASSEPISMNIFSASCRLNSGTCEMNSSAVAPSMPRLYILELLNISFHSQSSMIAPPAKRMLCLWAGMI